MGYVEDVFFRIYKKPVVPAERRLVFLVVKEILRPICVDTKRKYSIFMVTCGDDQIPTPNIVYSPFTAI